MELIVAKNNLDVIGNNNKLLWYLKQDLEYFRKITHENIVVMGRKTYDSLPIKPLPNRIHVIITRQPKNYISSNHIFYTNLEYALELLDKLQKKYKSKIIIAGGTAIYNYFFPYCKKLHITYVDNDLQGDAIFPISENIIEEDFNLLQENTHIDFTTKIYKANKIL